MPRLSMDIDINHLRLSERATALTDIDASLERIMVSDGRVQIKIKTSI